MIRRIVVVLMVTVALPLALPALSYAVPTYTQYACHLPDGTPAPADGFNSTADNGASATNLCASGGGLTVSLPTTTSTGTRVNGSWAYWPPYNQPIQRLVYHRMISNIAASDNSSTRHYSGPGETCGPSAPCLDSATLDPPISNPTMFQIF